jgi:thiamine pyrophosphokinase
MHVLILCDGEPPSRERLVYHRARAALFIAADGAGNAAAGLGVRPDMVIGDLDSYDRASWPGLEPIHRPDQDTNDLEKALELALSLDATSAVVLGATGRRLDHTLKNLSVLKQFDSSLRLHFEDAYAEIRLVTRALEIEGHPGQVVSLFPLSGRVEGITTEGLMYPLNGEALENGVRDGSSNQLTGTRARITVARGDLLVMVGRA